MKSETTQRFRQAYDSLPPEIKERTRQAYQLFQKDPEHPSLNLKKLETSRDVYSARINLNYRALGVKTEDTMVWFWIGNHSDYESLIKRF